MEDKASLAPCPYCGAAGVGGYEGCQEHMHEITARSFSDFRYAPLHRAVVDCYCLQHPEFYCVSAKSLAAHLTGVCVYMEHAGSPEMNAAVQRWLNGKVDFVKPSAPASRGEVTVLHLYRAGDPADYKIRLDEWAASIWEAYRELQAMAREYIRAALAGERGF